MRALRARGPTRRSPRTAPQPTAAQRPGAVSRPTRTGRRARRRREPRTGQCCAHTTLNAKPDSTPAPAAGYRSVWFVMCFDGPAHRQHARGRTSVGRASGSQPGGRRCELRDVAQSGQRTGLGDRGSRVRIPPSRPTTRSPRRLGRVVRQRPAKPRTPVRFRQASPRAHLRARPPWSGARARLIGPPC